MTISDIRGGAVLRRAGALGPSLVPAGVAGTVGLRAGDAAWDVLAWMPAGEPFPHGLSGATAESDGGLLLVGPADGANAMALRAIVPALRPQRLGPGPSFGLGDRLGIATPGHVAALLVNPGIMPVLAQQSARELGRTGRSFGDVLDAATFGALAAGWLTGFGADADHLKSTEDLDQAIMAGCSMFTADPIEVVPDIAADAPARTIDAAFEQVPWAGLEDDARGFGSRYPAALDLGTVMLPLPPAALRSAAARFGTAVVRITAMHRHLIAALGGRDVDFEVAVDELGHPTTHVDHVYLATELRRLGVRWQSLAPRFIGRFEKGIDYIGDPGAFMADITTHAAIARVLGPYKVSIHSGSDKGSIHHLAAQATVGAVHLKTSGTSYLVALGTLAADAPELMREVWRISLAAYETARLTYHVSAAADRVPRPGAIPASELPGLIQDPASREILHVTFGAILGRPAGDEFLQQVRGVIWAERDAYWASLAAHIAGQLRPFVPAHVIQATTH